MSTRAFPLTRAMNVMDMDLSVRSFNVIKGIEFGWVMKKLKSHEPPSQMVWVLALLEKMGALLARLRSQTPHLQSVRSRAVSVHVLSR